MHDEAHPYGAASYGEAFADVYDDWYQTVSDVGATVGALITLAGDGRVLELGVGTGRIALPLAAAGVAVDGLDASPAMLARLAAKDPEGSVVRILGDMANADGHEGARAVGRYRVVFAAFNTFFNLCGEGDHQACVTSVTRLLEPGGRFAVECFVPGPEPDGVERHEDRRADGAGGTVVRRTVRDPAGQTVHGVHEHQDVNGRITERPWVIRYLTPNQIDALCAATGLSLEHRWADWRGTPFDPDGATNHVSVYR